MSFLDFVAIKRSQVSDRSTDYKAISSFLSSTGGYDNIALVDKLRVWIVSMLERGLSVASRKRYIEKLGAIYKEYCRQENITENTFDQIRELKGIDIDVNVKEWQRELINFTRNFDTVLADVKTNPYAALFLYLLLNVSSDVKMAITLTIDNGISAFPQLTDIVNTKDFHHRRRYVFNLNQSRKRMPQLVKETTCGICRYLAMKGLHVPEVQTLPTILAVWIACARQQKIKFSDIKAVVDTIPAEYEYLRFIKGSELSSDDIQAIKLRVAESLAPSTRRWYAVRMRRGVLYDVFRHSVKTGFKDYFDERTLFYPQKKVYKKAENRVITELIPVIPDIVFLNILPRHVKYIDHMIKSENLGWIFRTTVGSSGDYSIIPSGSMLAFQRMIGVFTPEIRVSLTKEKPLGVGRNVRITGGIMEGYEGIIFDVKSESEGNIRQFYIRLSNDYAIRTEVKIEEFFVEPTDRLEKDITNR